MGAPAMRQRIIIIGVICLFVGFQFRLVDSFVLTHKATQFLHERAKESGFRTADPYNFDTMLMSAGPIAKKTITPPPWAGWALISVGAVLSLHGITLRDD
jgi:hypothetical protein